MKIKLLSFGLIWIIFLVSNNLNTTLAQSVSKETKKETDLLKVETVQSDKIKNSLNRWNKSDTNALNTPVDFDKIRKENDKPLPQQKMSKKEKTFWALFIVGMAALVFVAIKYYKECEVEDPNCPIDATVCPCLKYKEESK